MEELVAHVEHFLEMDGEKTVCMGGDLDGCLELAGGMTGIQDVPRLYEALRDRGYTRVVLRFLRRVDEPPVFDIIIRERVQVRDAATDKALKYEYISLLRFCRRQFAVGYPLQFVSSQEVRIAVRLRRKGYLFKRVRVWSACPIHKRAQLLHTGRERVPTYRTRSAQVLLEGVYLLARNRVRIYARFL